MDKTIIYKGEHFILCNNPTYITKYQLMEYGLVKLQVIAYVNSEEEAMDYLKNYK